MVHSDTPKLAAPCITNRQILFPFWKEVIMPSLTQFLLPVSQDNRLHPSHICLYISLFSLCERSRFSSSFRIPRRQLMKLSKIRSTATYHKCISELVSFGYIAYKPSYDHFRRSQIVIHDGWIEQDLNQ